MRFFNTRPENYKNSNISLGWHWLQATQLIEEQIFARRLTDLAVAEILETATVAPPQKKISRPVIACIAAFAALVLMQSCSRERALENYNFYGGITRANNYEPNGPFTTMLITDEMKAKAGADAHKGANVPPIPVNFHHNYIATIDGFAVRYANGTVYWKSPLDTLPAPAGNSSDRNGKRAVAAALTAADSKDNFYLFANDGAVYSFDSEGKRRWKTVLFSPQEKSLFSDLLIVQNSIVAAFSSNGTEGMVVCVNLEGAILWQRAFTLAPTRTPAALLPSGGSNSGEGERILLALSHNSTGESDSLYMLDARTGKTLWGKITPATRIVKSPVVGAGLVVCAGIQERNGERRDILYALNATDGTIQWTKYLTFTPQGISIGTQEEQNEPLLVVGGYRIGLGDALSLVLGLDARGTELWRLSYELAIIGAPMIGADNIVFIGEHNQALGVYVMNKRGEYSRVVSVSDAPLACLVPGVDVQNNLVFATTEQLGLFKVGSLPSQRLLPY